jgi:RNA recognition motif-containing protein
VFSFALIGSTENNPLGESVNVSKKIYVGNLSFDATEAEVRELFAQHGTVESVALITDRDTGRFRGFGFVEMEESAANAAIKALDGKDMNGRALKVNEAKPREARGGGDRGGGFSDRGRNNRRDRNRW